MSEARKRRKAAYHREWQRRNKEKSKEYQKRFRSSEKGQIYLASLKKTRKAIWATWYAGIGRDKRRLYDKHVKRLAMDKYGGKCVGCWTTELAVLSIDHVKNNGNVHRRTETKCVGNRFYRKLAKEPRSDDFQVLCLNCQFRKREYGPDISKWPSSEVRFLRNRYAGRL